MTICEVSDVQNWFLIGYQSRHSLENAEFVNETLINALIQQSQNKIFYSYCMYNEIRPRHYYIGDGVAKYAFSCALLIQFSNFQACCIFLTIIFVLVFSYTEAR